MVVPTVIFFIPMMAMSILFHESDECVHAHCVAQHRAHFRFDFVWKVPAKVRAISDDFSICRKKIEKVIGW